MIASAIAAAALSCVLRVGGMTIDAPLNCIALYPTPDLGTATGTIALKPATSPFGVAVTVDGRTRYRLVATISGLPEPRTLGGYTTYVAWAYTMSLDSAVKLGVVRNGTVDLGEVSLAQFRVLISAEKSSMVRERVGRLVMRGTSPSARLLAHRDVMQPSSMGTRVDTARTVGAHGGHGVTGWPMPAMPDRMSAMPGMHAMVPSVDPWRPSSTGDPVSRDRRVLRPRDGDTVTIAARRSVAMIDGKRVPMYGYDNRIPGPVIEVAQGAAIVARFNNGVDLPGSVHWHGVRLDNAFDGAPGLTQREVAPLDSFLYRLRFPDAGVFWYHPHVREDIQQGLGLFGNIIVKPRDTMYYSPVNREELLMLSDALIADSSVMPFGGDRPTHALMGRFGNVLLVNGERQPLLTANRGDVVRYYLTNASSARTYNVSFDGARMKLVAGDGGKFEREEWVESVIIAPSERYVVEVQFSHAGRVHFLNRVQALDHMIGAYWREVDTLAIVNVAMPASKPLYAKSFTTLRTNADVRTSLTPFRRAFDRPVDRELVLTLRTTGLPPAIAAMLIGVNAALEWNDGMPMMNWLTTSREVGWILRDPATGRENMDIDWRFKRGDVIKLRLFNDPSSSHAMAHPIHLHGQRFLVLTRDGVRSENLVWKDTAIIPAGETVELLVDMSNPGRWMLHCHIAEHLSGGMMASFTVQ